MGVSLNGGTPISHPEMIIFSRKTHGCWVPPFLETSICFLKWKVGDDTLAFWLEEEL